MLFLWISWEKSTSVSSDAHLFDLTEGVLVRSHVDEVKDGTSRADSEDNDELGKRFVPIIDVALTTPSSDDWDTIEVSNPFSLASSTSIWHCNAARQIGVELSGKDSFSPSLTTTL